MLDEDYWAKKPELQICKGKVKQNKPGFLFLFFGYYMLHSWELILLIWLLPALRLYPKEGCNDKFELTQLLHYIFIKLSLLL